MINDEKMVKYVKLSADDHDKIMKICKHHDITFQQLTIGLLRTKIHEEDVLIRDKDRKSGLKWSNDKGWHQDETDDTGKYFTDVECMEDALFLIGQLNPHNDRDWDILYILARNVGRNIHKWGYHFDRASVAFMFSAMNSGFVGVFTNIHQLMKEGIEEANAMRELNKTFIEEDEEWGVCPHS